MESPFASIRTAVDDAEAAWLAAVGVPDAGCLMGTENAQVDRMSEPGIVALNASIAVLKRHVDAIHAPVAAGIAERSASNRGSEGLARKNGHRTPAKLIAAATGGHTGDAARLIRVGAATAGRMTFSGERTEPRRPHIAIGLAAATLSVAAADAIASMLDRIAMRVDLVTLEDAEKTLVAQAALLSLDELNAVLCRAEAILDPDGLEPKLEGMRAENTLTFREDRRGRLILDGDFDPVTGAPIKIVLEAFVTHVLRTSRGRNVVADHAGAIADGDCAGGAANHDPAGGTADDDRSGGAAHDDWRGEAGPVVTETRSIPQIQADALAAICRHVIGCDSSEVPLESTTVVVEMPLEAVTDGTSVATIQGIAQPIDAGTARRMAASAKIIPMVLGTDSEVLDLGRSERFFNRAQRRALAHRDGGCASCGLPPSMTEAHHIKWWELKIGKTDLSNGILLCTRCHHLIHTEGWEIRIDPPPSGDLTGGTVWFIPPLHVDPDQTPRLGGRKRFDYTHQFDFARAA